MLDTISETSTAHTLNEMTLYAKRPFSDELDYRPLPDADTLRHGLSDVFDVLLGMFTDTRLDDDTQGILWSFVNSFHRKVERIQKDLDQNEDVQQKSQREQDGSEVKSVELEDLITEGQTLIEQRAAFELMRDYGGELFEANTGSLWRPLTGSKINHITMTASMIDSRDYIKAKQRTESRAFIPEGTLIAFTGGVEYQDYKIIWATLDKTKAKHADMVLAHGGGTKGAELIAAKWAKARAVPTVIFRPDWKKYNRAAPFKRNDQMLAENPAGVIIFSGSGITENLADKAKQMGIKVYRPIPKT
tara:strand:- start:1154 stop:2062 length:909 start_codon:yes stop_codon:yes gene_type:complete